MLSALTRPDMFPYATAAGVLLGLVILEILGTLVGAGPLASLGHVFGLHAHGGPPGSAHAPEGPGDRGGFSILGWLGDGRAPFAAVLLSLLACFALAGAALVSFCSAARIPCPPIVSVPVATVVAVALTRSVARIVGRVMPQDETYAIGPESLLGSLAVVTVGPVREGHRGRGRTRDRYGNLHFPLLEVADGAMSFAPGETVVLLAHRSGAFLVTAPDPNTLPRGRTDG